jgi:hypothetical protein
VQVREETFARLRELFDEKEVVEITATVGFLFFFFLSPFRSLGEERVLTDHDCQVACYNCVSRFLVALDGECSVSLWLQVACSGLTVTAVGEKNGLGPDAVH